MRVWIVATFACATSTCCSIVRSLASSSSRRRLGCLQRRSAHIQILLRAGALGDESGAAFDLDLGKFDFALAPDDGRLGDRRLFLRGGDVCLGLGQLRLQRSGVQTDQYLARLDECAFVNEDFLDPSGSLAATSTSLASIRPLPEAIPFGSVDCICCQY